MALTPPTAREPSGGRQRLQGFVLCLLGSALAIGMATAAWRSAATFLHPGESIDGDRFTGTLVQGQFTLALFLSVAFTGLVFVAAGANLMATGRRDRRLLWLAAAALGCTALLAWQVSTL